jgi:DNA repair protein RadC
VSAEPALPGLDDRAADDQPHYLGHRERLRQRFLASPDSLPDYEVLELLLSSVIPRVDTKPLAKALIDEFGGYGEVLAAPAPVLEAFPRVGKAKISPTVAAYLKVAEHSARRLARLAVKDMPILTRWDQLIDYCNMVMGRLPSEQFRLLFLDRKNVLIADELQQQGTIDHTPLYPREVVKRALDLNASSLIMVHDHRNHTEASNVNALAA